MLEQHGVVVGAKSLCICMLQKWFLIEWCDLINGLTVDSALLKSELLLGIGKRV
jgi:hypothetical protein